MPPSIYDFLPPGTREQAGYAGLGALAQALLAGGAPTTTPGAGIAALGQGFSGFGQAYNGRLNSGVQQAAMGMQLADAQRKQDQLKAQQDAISAMFTPPPVQMAMAGNDRAGPTMQAAQAAQPPIAQMFPGSDVNTLRNYATAFPEQFSAAVGAKMLPKDRNPLVLKEGDVAVDPVTFRPVASGNPKTQQPTDFERALAAAGLQPGTPAYQAAARAYVDRKGQPPQVSIDLKQEGAEAKKVGDFYGDQFAEWQKGAMTAPSRLGKLDRLDSLLSKAYTGTGGETMQATNRALKAAGDAMGLDTSRLTEKVGSAEAAQALANEMALQMRNPSGGAGMPGALSDKDREFLQSMVPSLSATAEGRKQIIETQRRLIKREQDVARMAREYRKKNGHMDEGFFNELEDWSSKNPLFDGMKSPQGGAATRIRFDAQGNVIQ